MENKCLFCYKIINPEELRTDAGGNGYHERCSKKFFGKTVPPQLNFAEDQLLELAELVIKSHKTVTGVQPKLSLGITKVPNVPDRFTIVGLWGEYILKPQTKLYPNLPENEDLTMHLAQISKISTVKHSLIRLKSGQLAYITRRVDRVGQSKLPMEDMCQLTERLTEHKYRGSYEQVARALKKSSANPGLDIINFFEQVLFSFLTGNNDMHLKNFSLLKTKSGYNLCPAYDLLASALVMEGDDEELALNLNGKKKNIKATDFKTAMKGAGIDQKAVDNVIGKYEKEIPKWLSFIGLSFLPDTAKAAYKSLILSRAEQIGF